MKVADELIALSKLCLYQKSEDCSHILATYTKVKQLLAWSVKLRMTVVTKVSYTVLCSCYMQDICMQHRPINLE